LDEKAIKQSATAKIEIVAAFARSMHQFFQIIFQIEKNLTGNSKLSCYYFFLLARRNLLSFGLE
jgi:hypothetical protein